MISILIPVYNYKILDLVTLLNEQLQSSDILFEIICLDDRSDDLYTATNKTVEQFKNTAYKVNDLNLGRTKTRQKLASLAKYDWLLFLDADVMPKSNTFIKNYIKYINTDFDAIFGGFAYSNIPPDPHYRLRWKYGKTNEQKLAKHRNTKPFKVIISANFLIRKALFLGINAKVEENTYGLDNIFGALLKSENANIFHIDNEVYHLGIEANTTYLKKKEASALTVLNHYKTNKIKDHQNDLLSTFITFKRYKLNYVFRLIYLVFGSILKKKLISKNPSIKLLQLYRISFMCYQDLKTHNINI